MWSAGPGTPNHYQQLDALGLYNQQVPLIREIKTYTHRALESGRREMYVGLGGMCEEMKSSLWVRVRVPVMTFAWNLRPGTLCIVVPKVMCFCVHFVVSYYCVPCPSHIQEC
jgi:hypothetical protein